MQYHEQMRLPGQIIVGALAFKIAAVPAAFGDDLTVTSFSSYAGQTNILLQAAGNIYFSGGSMNLPALPPGAASGQLVVQAGGNITINNGSVVIAGAGWNVSMVAGTSFSGMTPPAGNDGIYLIGSAYLQSQDGDIDLSATNELIVGSGAIRTIGGGNIYVTALYGNVNTGTSIGGFTYLTAAPYYAPSPSLGGISTAAGGNVSVNAGGDVISFPTTMVVAGDAGAGTFGPEPGNVTIIAGGNVYGHYVMMNGTGIINAGQDIGTSANNVALSLAKGSWDLDAQKDIYLQEVRNPNGVFNAKTLISGKPAAGNHLFDYDPLATVSLTASDGVYLTGYILPRPNGAVPLLLPPSVVINAGQSGTVLQTPNATDGSGSRVTLSDYDLTLFPSPYGNLQITTAAGGGLTGGNADGSPPYLLMSDSSRTSWSTVTSGPQPFSSTDHAGMPPELTNTNPAIINLSGSMENVGLQTCKQTQITVTGDMTGCSFYGENLQSSQITSLNVGGQIYNQSSFTSVILSQDFPALPAANLPPGTVNSLTQTLELAVNPAMIASLSATGIPPSQLENYYLQNAAMFPGLVLQDLVYDPNRQTLTAIGPMTAQVLAALTQPTLTFVVYGSDGYPEVDGSGHFVTDNIPWTPASSANYSKINQLYMQSQGAPTLGFGSGAYVVGGTGQFDIAAGSISLGKGLGILSLGIGSMLGTDYSFLAPYISSGATINVTVTGNLDMLGSTIAALGGGDVNVTSTGGMMDLGSANLVSFENQIAQSDELGLGIYTSGGGNVNVIASGNVDIDSSTIATFNGGNVLVESQTGSVNTGAGGELSFPVNFYSPTYSGAEPVERVPESGIVTFTLLNASEIPGAATAPGNITVLTPQGNILANQGSILQESLGGVITGNSIVTLTAGTPGTGGWGSTNPPIYIGNIYLGNAAVIGETVNLEATGVITHPDFSTTIAQINGLVTVSWNADGIQLNTQDIPAFIIETSSNLVDWVTTNPSVSTNLYGGLSFELPLSANPGCGFYRILWQ